MAADDPDAAMWEIDENLVRAELTKAEVAEHLVRRKEKYLERHPETAKGVAQGEGMKRSAGDLSVNLTARSFTADTASKTGMSERAVRRAVHRGERIAPDVIHDVVGTKLDTGAALDRLAKLEPEEQRKAVAAGELPPVAPAQEAPIKPAGLRRRRGNDLTVGRWGFWPGWGEAGSMVRRRSPPPN